MALADLPPPSYEDAISHSINTRLPITHHDSLVLDGHTIYPAAPPSQFLYQISSPPRQGLPSTYAIQKWRFRLPDPLGQDDSDNDGMLLKSRLQHIYDVCEQHRGLRPAVRLDGRAAHRQCYREVVLQGGHTGWTTCAATEGWFRADVALRDRFKADARISWRSRDGVLVAVETRAGRRGGRLLPRLDIRAVLKEKDLDLLVACWVARVWKEAQGEARASLVWKELKRLAGRTSLRKGDSNPTSTSTSTSTLAERAGVADACACG
ncbi:hypothetical protein E4U32_004754 [Claviceps aff. humidiphila group G2b]|nr:hypothetical protein E4U32_004754 [Claviceps aff. humidiphila group G2b]